MLPLLDFGFFTLPTYPLLTSLAFCVGVIWFYFRCLAHRADIRVAMDLTMWVMVFGLIGARGFHICYEEPGFYWQHPWDVFKVWQGGFVFFGGWIGGFLGGLTFLWRRGILSQFEYWANLAAPVIALAYAIGRLACFLQGCCYGRICDLPWAITFSSHQHWGIELAPRHPTQLYAIFLELISLFLLLAWEKSRARQQRPAPPIFALWLVLHGIGRMIMELFREDPRGQLLFGFGVSFWIALLMALAGALTLRHNRTRA